MAEKSYLTIFSQIRTLREYIYWRDQTETLSRAKQLTDRSVITGRRYSTLPCNCAALYVRRYPQVLASHCRPSASDVPSADVPRKRKTWSVQSREARFRGPRCACICICMALFRCTWTRRVPGRSESYASIIGVCGRVIDRALLLSSVSHGDMESWCSEHFSGRRRDPPWPGSLLYGRVWFPLLISFFHSSIMVP